MTIDNYRFSITVTTDETGSVDIAIQVPETFNGIDPRISNGRFFSSALLWAVSPVVGDRISAICVKDIDGIIPVPVRAAFPNYPILGYSIDPDMTYEGPITPSVFLNPSRLIEIGPVDPQSPRFIPSGLYLCATFVSGDSQAGRVLYGNLLWTKRV